MLEIRRRQRREYVVLQMFASVRAPTVARMRRMTRASLVLTIAGVLAGLPAAACAQVFTAACSDGLGNPDSLVSAIAAANGAPGPDTVELGAGCVYLFQDRQSIWYGPDALPPVASDITIEGNGATIARDRTARPFRLFFVGADATSSDTANYVSPGPGVLTLRDVTLTGGLAKGGDSRRGGGGAGMGGAIFNQGTVVIERSSLVANTAQGGSSTNAAADPSGGGIGGDSFSGRGGGFAATSSFEGGAGGSGGSQGAGGGAGFRIDENGHAGDSSGHGAGGGSPTGLGASGGNAAANGGDGGGGGGAGGSGGGGTGGGFGAGGVGSGVTSGGGGGVGSGGGSGFVAGGGGGFGGGGGAATGIGSPAGAGGFGGGGGAADIVTGIGAGAPGFGGGTPSGVAGGGGAGMGGAIFNMQGRLTIRASTLSGNVAIGGVDDVPDHAKGIGGAVFNLSGSVIADGSTFAANSAKYDGASIYDLVYDGQTARVARTTLRDTIVAGGIGSTDVTSIKTAYISPPNLGTALVDVGQFDLVTTMAAREQGAITGAPLTADPRLGALRDNGGPTATMAPAAGSPAIDAGSAFGLTTDQRGAARPYDFGSLANAGDGSDIGAYEVQAPAGSGGGVASASGSRPAFGARTLVTLRLGAKRIPARGPLPVVVTNANRFAVSGRLSAATTTRRRVALAARSIRVRAGARATAKLALPTRLRLRFAHTGRLTLRLRAAVRDPAGHTRTVTKTVSVPLRRRHR